MKKPSNVSAKSSEWVVNSIVAVFFICVMTLGLIGFVWKWFHASSPKVSIESINDNVAKSAVPNLGNQLGRGVKWLAFEELGPEVEQGCAGWLFLTDERRTYEFSVENEAKRLTAIQLLAERLKRKNIQLVVAFVPDKSRIQKEQLCHLTRPAEFAPRVERWVQRLEKAGVLAVDLAQSMSGESSESVFYYATDTHWNEKGAEQAAIAIAQQVNLLPIDIVPKIQYEKEKEGLEKYQGDLLKLAGIEELPFWFTRDLQETKERIVFKENAHEQDDSEDLFGDELLPSVFLIGSSFSKNSYFIEFLQAQLETIIPNIALEGGGFWRAANQYFESAAFLKTPPKILIWEVPERMIQAPIELDESSWLDSIKP